MGIVVNPMREWGDLVVGGENGAPYRVPRGVGGQVLTVHPVTLRLVWSDVPTIAGARGAQGLQGPQGPQGLQGPQGDPGSGLEHGSDWPTAPYAGLHFFFDPAALEFVYGTGWLSAAPFFFPTAVTPPLPYILDLAWPAPAGYRAWRIVGGYLIPPVDNTGATDVAAELNAWLAILPSNSFIVYGGTYQLSTGQQFDLDGPILAGAATFSLTGPGTSTSESCFCINSGSTITFAGAFSIVGSNPSPGVYVAGAQKQSAVCVRGTASDVTITGITASALYGDLVSIRDTADNVVAHGNTATDVGRWACAVISGTNIRFHDNFVGICGYGAFDCEPNAGDAVAHVRFDHNTLDTFGLVHLLACNGAAGPVVGSLPALPDAGYPVNSYVNLAGELWQNQSDVWVDVGAETTIDDVECDNNIVTGSSGVYSTLHCDSHVAYAPRRTDINIHHNAAASTATYYPIMRFAHVDGLTIANNTQALDGNGTPLTVSDCTGFDYEGCTTFNAYALHTVPQCFRKLNEAVPGTGAAVDEMGFINGTYEASPTSAAGLIAGESEKAVLFDGTTQGVTIGDHAALRTAHKSVMALINLTTGETDGDVANLGDSGFHGWRLRVVANGLIWKVTDGSATAVTCSSGGAITAGTTYLVIGTHDGAHAAVYRNGALSQVKAAAFALGYGALVDERFCSYAGANRLACTAEKIAEWDRGLTAWEAAALGIFAQL